MTTVPPQAPSVPPPAPAAATQTSGLAIASLVCSLAGLCTAGLGAVVGVIFGIVALAKIKRSRGALKGTGLAIGGLAAGGLIIILHALLTCLALYLYMLSSSCSRETPAEARVHSLMISVQTVRAQLLLYKIQHTGQYPGSTTDATLFARQMTQYTDADGNVSASPDTTHRYGPYLESVPANPISGINTVEVVSHADFNFSVPSSDGGWWFNMATGEFRANLTDIHAASDGTKLNAL